MGEEHELEDLEGVGEKTIRRLNEAGYYSIVGLAKTSGETLADVTGIGSGKAASIVEEARGHIQGGSFMDGVSVKKKKGESKRISTGSSNLDGLLGGGVPTSYITEAYGKFSTAKSQLAHQLAVNVQLPEDQGGLGQECIYIDTEDTFMPARIESMAEAVGMNTEDALANIHVAEAFDSGHQFSIGKKLHQKCSDSDVGLIVVDSIIAHFRVDYGGRGELSDRQTKLNKHLKDLRRAANTFNIAVYITNQVMEDPGVQYGNPIKPVGGNVLAHASFYRMWLRSKSKCKVARLVDSPDLPQGEATFKIEEEGIRDHDG